VDDVRVVVTGLGAVSPVGIGREALWQALLEGRHGIAPVTSFDTAAYRVKNGAEIQGFDPRAHLPSSIELPPARASQFAVVAAHLALDDAGLDVHERQELYARVGVAMGTTSGEPLEIEHFDDLYVADRLGDVGPEFMDLYPCHTIAANVAAAFGFGGPNIMLPAACAAGNYAMGFALDALRRGRADVMLAGGADAFSRITFTGFARLGGVSPDLCRPFDRNRLGMIPGEGGAVLVLETLERARRRGAPVYAEVAGYGLSCDAHHMTAAHPEGDGLARSMMAALADAQLERGQVDYISAHGTGTKTNDRLETLALERAFGERASKIPVSSIKSMLGHTMGAASAFESLVCALAVTEDRVPPTANFEEPDPECNLDVVPNVAREMPVAVALNNASAFGGNNATVVFRKVTS
jgi:3-oxoacyl-[acyl-carrier-protein] synthase II